MTNLNEKARRLRELHERPALLLANAWDAGSAAIVASCGAPAIATSSAGVAWALGRPDGERLAREEMLDVLRRVVSTVDVPVTADVEGGYGRTPGEVAATVRAVLDAGAVGINLEDAAPDRSLYTVDEQVARVRAAYEAAVRYGVPEFVVNARTDVYLRGSGELDEARTRLAAYARVGAGCLFVPGLEDLDALRSLAAELPLPINALAGPGRPAVADLVAAGVRRISLGGVLARVAYTAARRATVELFATGTYAQSAGILSFAEMDALFGG